MTRHLAGLRPRLLLVVFLPWLAALVYIAAIDRRFEREADAEIAQALAYSLRIAKAEQFALAENARNFLLMLDAFTRATTASSGEPCRRALAELHRQHPQFQNFGFLDARGEILCAALPNRERVSFAGLEFVTDAVKLGTMSMSNYQLGPVTNLPQIGFALPLRDAGKEVTRLLFVTTHLNTLRNQYEPNRLPAGYDLIVTDTAGRLVFAQPPRAELVGRELPKGIDFRARPGNADAQPFSRQGLDGKMRLARASLLEVGSGRLHLSVGLPQAMVTARAWELRRTEIITFTMIGLGALLLTWYAAELLMLAKLRTIRDTIGLWAQGDLRARTDIAPGRGELRQLAGDLDAMAAALASLARRHALILDAAGEGIYGLDNHACVNFVNPAAAALLGYSPEDLLHRPLEQTIGPRVVDETTGTDTQHALPLSFCDRTQHRVASIHYRRRDGSFLRADLVRTPLYEQGRQVGVVDVFSDRSEQYRARAALQESEARLRAFIDAAPDAMVVIAASGRITFANEEAARLTGYSLGELRDAPAEMLVPQEYRSEHLVQRALGSPAGADHEPEVRVETILLQKSGARLPVEIGLAQFSTREGRFVVTIARDVSVRKAAEAQLREFAETLERRVKLRTATLERAYRDLEAFSYTVAHDLRAPLRSINGFTQLVLQGEGERFSASGRELFERVIRNARKMDELIEDILRYSHSATGSVERQEVDMHALVAAVLPELREHYPGTQVEVLELPRIQGDAAMLRQVWSNLIGNALKFSAVRDRPRVEIGCRRAQECVFYVADNGVGFDMAHADRLFGMFQRMHAGEQFPGTGVGLAIVRRLIERQGGQIWAKAEPGQGATFYFTLGSCADPAGAVTDPPASGDHHRAFPNEAPDFRPSPD